MCITSVFRKLFLCVAIGGHSVLGVGIEREKIEELLYAMNQTRVEVTVTEDKESTEANDSATYEK